MFVNEKINTMTGAKAIINTLKHLGINTIFGYPGGIVLDLYNELYLTPEIKHVLVRHEQSAVHAAEGYARVSNKCGVVLVTSGPGATNTVTGIVNAYLDGYPLLVLTGQVDKKLIGKNAFQEANICDITKSCTKAVFQITDANDIQKTIIKAHKIATSGKNGPVVIDLAKNIFTQNITISDNQDIEEEILNKINISEVERIYTKIISAEKPVIIAGGGVNHSQAYEDLKYFCEKYNIPVVSTMMGLGGIDCINRLYFGMVGIFGDNCANELLRQSDLIISLGARFNDRITCMFKNEELDNKIIQIDIDNEEISKTITAKDFIVGDVKEFLKILNSLNNNSDKNFIKWYQEAINLKELNQISQKTTNCIHSFEVMQKLQNYTKNMDVIFTSEVGQHQLWAVKNLEFNPNRKIFVSGGSGTMGFGLPAAIGAAVAMPEKTVICITGDGSLQMSLGELSVCKDYGLNIKILILNNGYLGMVRQLQEKLFEGRYSNTKISNPDFVKLAESFGIKALKINSLDKIENALTQVFSIKGTSIIDFEIEPMEIV